MRCEGDHESLIVTDMIGGDVICMITSSDIRQIVLYITLYLEQYCGREVHVNCDFHSEMEEI
jgi:hypothetical protein